MIRVELVSFGYHFGQPKETVKNFNLRSLPNPPVHLRKNYTGIHKALQKELFGNDKVVEFIGDLSLQLEEEILRLLADSLELASFGFGCQEGKHRSVAVVEHLAMQLQTNPKFSQVSFSANHRDLAKTKKQIKKRK